MCIRDRHNEKHENRTVATITPEVPREQPRPEETQPEAVAAPAVTDAPPETVATSLFPDIEPEKPKEEVADLTPRAYERNYIYEFRTGHEHGTYRCR